MKARQAAYRFDSYRSGVRVATTKDAVDPIIHKGYLGELADAYLPARTDRKDPQVSPLYADLKGLPPTLIQVGAAETLLADGPALRRRRLTAAMPDGWPTPPVVWTPELNPHGLDDDGRVARCKPGAHKRRHRGPADDYEDDF